MTSFTDTFGGTVIYPAQPSYISYTSTSSLTPSWPLESAPNNNVVAAINDINFTAAGLNITLADATNVSTGLAPLWNNIGANSFTLNTSTGGVILTATAGAAWITYLADNTTSGGTWRTFQMGAGTSSASAAALAGLGLKAITTTLNQEYPSIPLSTTPQTLTTADRAAFIVWSGGAAAFTSSALATLTSGWFCNIANQGTGAIIITPPSGTIDGSATKTLNPGDTCILWTDAANMYTLGFGQSAVFAFTYNIVNVGGLSGTYTLSGTQLNKTAIKFTGALAGNLDIIVPSTVQQYWVDNSTTGAFVLGVRTITQASPGVSISNGSTRMIDYCDGTNVVNANTNGLSSPITVAQGGTGASTAAGARTNLDVPSTLDAFSYTLMFS